MVFLMDVFKRNITTIKYTMNKVCDTFISNYVNYFSVNIIIVYIYIYI